MLRFVLCCLHLLYLSSICGNQIYVVKLLEFGSIYLEMGCNSLVESLFLEDTLPLSERCDIVYIRSGI